MTKEVNPEEIREVLTYIKMINEFDRRNFLRLQHLNEIIWGFLFINTGIMDFIFFHTGIEDMVGIPWGIASLFGMAISLYINRAHPKDTISEEVHESTLQIRRAFRYTFVITIVVWILLLAMTVIFSLFFLIMPIIAVLLAAVYFMSTAGGVDNFDYKKVINPKYRSHFIPFVALLSGVINLIGVAITPNFIAYMGVIFGGLVGFAFILVTFVDQSVH